MYHHIKEALARTLELQSSQIILETPKNRDFGHYATPLAFTLAKILKQSPMAIAQDIAKKLEKVKGLEGLEIFSKVEVVNGYINLTLSQSFLDTMARQLLGSAESTGAESKKADSKSTDSTPSAKKSEPILLEYISANPTGPMHIGHARGAMFGDALQRLGKYLGFDIKTEYYINDAGAQIETLGRSVIFAGKIHFLKEAVSYPEKCYQGDYITEIAKLAKEEFGEEIFDEAHLPKVAEFAKNLMLAEIKQNLADAGIAFDYFVSERGLYTQWEEVYKKLEKSGATYESEGKIWLKSQEKGDEKDRVIVRENQEPTYLAGDIIYHHDKFTRPYGHYINIWGADHHGYINRVKASIEFLGFDSQKLEVILAQMVSLLKDGEAYKMSKRAGNFVLMSDVIEDIGADALRFVMLSKSLDTPLVFDVADLEKQDSNNPLFYINYANARIHTLLKKSSQAKDLANISLATLAHTDGMHLLFQALQIHKVLEHAFKERAPHKVCDYLKALAGDFHSFYNAGKILGTNHEAELLKICSCVSASLTLGLRTLGIAIKTQM